MRLRNFCLLALIAGIFLVPACCGQAFKVPPKPRARVPSAAHFDLVDGRVVLAIHLDGRGPFRFVLDSASDRNFISAEIARALGLKPEDSAASGSDNQKEWSANVRHIEIANVSLLDQDVTVVPESEQRTILGGGIQGVLGLAAFKQSVVRVDYEHHLLSFTPFSDFIYTGNGKVLSFDATAGVPAVFATLDGFAGEFAVSTGNNASLMLYPSFAEKNFLDEKYQNKLAGTANWPYGHLVNASIVRARKLDLGGFDVQDPILTIFQSDAGASSPENDDGVIGFGILRQFNLIIDCKHQQLILEPNSQFGRRPSYDRAGILLAQKGKDFSVTDVVPGGPAAEAGVKVGDQIIAVNGVPASKLALPELENKLKEDPPGTRMRLTLDPAEAASQQTEQTPTKSATKSSNDPPAKEVVIVLRDLV